MRLLDSITDSVDMNLSKLGEIVEDRGVWCAVVHGVAKSQTWLSDWTTKQCHLWIWVRNVVCVCIDIASSVGEGNGTPLQYSCLENPWTEEPGRLQSVGSWRVGHDWANSLSLFTFMHWIRKWQPTPVFLPRESQGRGSLVGCCLWGRTELDTTEAT